MPVVQQSVKIRVADVSNNTGEIFDVDVIGMLWNALDDSLKSKGYAWTGQPTSPPPLVLEAHIVKYEKGNMGLRPFLPMWGKTLLVVKCDLKKDNQVIATLESKHEFSYGSGLFTYGAWSKVFSKVAEDIVAQVAKKV